MQRIASILLLTLTTVVSSIPAARAGAAPAAAPAARLAFPDTEPGRHAAAWFGAYNAAGDEEMRRVLAEHVAPAGLKHRPIEARLAVVHDLRAEHGRLTPAAVIRTAPAELAVRTRAEHGALLRITFLCEPDPPHGLLGLRIEDDEDAAAAEEEAAAAAGPPMTEAEVVAALRAHVDSLARIGAFSGAVLLARGDQVLVREAHGLASRPDRIPNRPDTKFNLGSINKAFTRIAIEQLVAAGKLRLDDTIDRHLADYPREKGRRITIAHLLEHRAGTGDIFGEQFAASRDSLRTMDDWMNLLRDQPLEFEPGTRQQYSNAGYTLLGIVVERVSGQAYHDYIREHVYRPAGMRNTDSYAKDEKVENRATGYTRQLGRGPGGPLRENTSYLPGRPGPAGGGYSTVDDLHAFVRAVRAGKLGVKESDAARGIAGGAPGINAALVAAGDYTVVVLANLDPPIAERVLTRVTGWLTRAGALPARGVEQPPGARP